MKRSGIKTAFFLFKKNPLGKVISYSLNGNESIFRIKKLYVIMDIITI